MMQDLEEFGASLRARIEEAAEALGHDLGWRLLASPLAVLDGAPLALIGLHPGGATDRPDHPKLCTESGSAYVDEVWDPSKPAGESRLQIQVRMLFSALGHVPETVLASHLVPFRASSTESLVNPGASFHFGRELWKDIFARVTPPLVVTMGGEAYDNISAILGADEEERIPVGWGEVQAKQARFPGGRVVGLPYLGQFAIIGRAKSRDALAQLFPEGSFLE